MKYKGTLSEEATILLLRLTPGIKEGLELLTDNCKSEYWQGVKDAVLMLNKITLENET